MAADLHVVQDPDAEAALLEERQLTDLATGLQYPRDPYGHLWPWAFRHPKIEETRMMDIKYLLDVCHREETDWVPEILHTDQDRTPPPAS